MPELLATINVLCAERPASFCRHLLDTVKNAERVMSSFFHNLRWIWMCDIIETSLFHFISNFLTAIVLICLNILCNISFNCNVFTYLLTCRLSNHSSTKLKVGTKSSWWMLLFNHPLLPSAFSKIKKITTTSTGLINR